MNLFGVVMRHVLDVHATFGAGNDGDAPAGPIDQHGEIELLGDINAVGDIEAVDLLAGGTGLDRHQRVAQHVGRRRAHTVG